MAHSFAFLGPTDQHYVMKGGFCISSFAIIREGSKLLLVKPLDHPRWLGEWAPNWRIYDPVSLSEEYRRWRFPSTYHFEGEAPEEALGRVMVEQLGLPQYAVTNHRLKSYFSPSRRFPGEMHWDYCFFFEISLKDPPVGRPWFSAVEFREGSSLRPLEFGSAQGALLEDLLKVDTDPRSPATPAPSVPPQKA